MNIENLRTTVNINKKIGVSLWIGDKEPDFPTKCTILHNSYKFDRLYIITNLNPWKYPTSEGNSSRITYLSAHELFKWTEDKYGLVEELTGNYYADILCYNAAMILREAYDIDCSKAFKVDLDYWIYNSWTLNQLFDRDFYMFTDTSTYINNIGELYWNAAISLTSDENIYIKRINEDIKKILNAYKGSYEDMPYTALGPRLSNSYKFEFNNLFGNKVNTISVHPGVLTNGSNFIKYNPYCLGVHLMISQIKKLGWSIRTLDEFNGRLEIKLEYAIE